VGAGAEEASQREVDRGAGAGERRACGMADLPGWIKWLWW